MTEIANPSASDLAQVFSQLEEHYAKIDRAEVAMSQLPQIECPLVHVFTPGLYTRELTVPAGTFFTSKIHLTEHPFIVSKGTISVWVNGQVEFITAPFLGVTFPGTRRVFYTHEETVWTTFHPTDLTDVDEIEAQIIFKHDEHLKLPATELIEGGK